MHSLSFLFLLIEFFDELNYGIAGAALPSIRHDLGLTYAQVGLLLGLPHFLGSFIEPVLMLLGDTPLRKRLVAGGGLAVMLSLLLIATSQSFPILLVGVILGFPASGAFVTLSQATLIDLNPGREPHMMARWTLFGSIGNLIGPVDPGSWFFVDVWMAVGILCLAGLALRADHPGLAAPVSCLPRQAAMPHWVRFESRLKHNDPQSFAESEVSHYKPQSFTLDRTAPGI